MRPSGGVGSDMGKRLAFIFVFLPRGTARSLGKTGTETVFGRSDIDQTARAVQPEMTSRLPCPCGRGGCAAATTRQLREHATFEGADQRGRIVGQPAKSVPTIAGLHLRQSRQGHGAAL